MSEEHQARLHETSDMSARAVSWFAVSLIISVVALAFLVWRMEVHLDPGGPAWPHQPGTSSPRFQASGPVLQSAAAGDLQALQAEEGRILRESGWVDRKAGVIRIPLKRAMDLILQRGLPVTGTTMPLPGPQTNVPSLQPPAPSQGGTP